MYKKFIDEELIFKLSSSLSIEKVFVNDNDFYIQVDNIYENPDMIRQLILDLPTTTNPLVNGGFPFGKDSGRICIYLNMYSVIDFLANTIKNYYNPNRPLLDIKNTIGSSPFMANVMTGNNIDTNYPHVDTDTPEHYACTIYFNKENELSGGTGFYTIDGSLRGNHNTDTKNKKYNLLAKSDMAFNRMIIYPSDWWHRSYIEAENFVNGNYRISQQFFI